MAQDVPLNGSIVKIRHPFAPIVLSIITLGIYGLYWYYAVNKELEVSGQKVAPVISLLAITFGVILVIPPFVSLYNTADRIRRTQDNQGTTSQISPVLALVMVFIPIVSFFLTVYLQSNLNSAWERVPTTS
jgi:drug/metabolite transporter (DMT)-like permease